MTGGPDEPGLQQRLWGMMRGYMVSSGTPADSNRSSFLSVAQGYGGGGQKGRGSPGGGGEEGSGGGVRVRGPSKPS